jgi:hypothetical protein
MRTLLTAVVIAMAPALLFDAAAHASSHRNDKVYQAAISNREGALELLEAIVDIDSGTGRHRGRQQGRSGAWSRA